MDLHADAEARLHASGKLQEVTVGAVKAVTFQPVLDCAPLTLELQGAPDTSITDIYFQTSPTHLQVVAAIGGGALAPTLLISDLPEIVPTGNRIAVDGGVVEKDPDRTVVVFPSRYLSVTLSSQGSATSVDGLVVKANVAVTQRDDPPTQEETDSAQKLLADLKDAVPKLECSKDIEVAFDVGGIRVLDIMRVTAAVQRELKTQQQIANRVWKAVTTVDPRVTTENIRAIGDLVVFDAIANSNDAQKMLIDTLSDLGKKAHLPEFGWVPDVPLPGPIPNPQTQPTPVPHVCVTWGIVHPC